MAQPKQKCVVSHGFGWGIYCNYLNCFCLCGFPGYVAFLTGCEASCEILEMVYFASCSMCFSLLFFFHVFVRLCYEMWFMDIHGSPTFEKTKNKLAQADFCLSRATVVDLESILTKTTAVQSHRKIISISTLIPSRRISCRMANQVGALNHSFASFWNLLF